ncbi:asparagine synthase-related protein [Sphingomonas sp.]|uniref:asparagine synthetase B family protein n=1 Tax=Sphingomonas sp. TaxID=28214 RepID=UPI0025D918BA|nr:asparagine synthase-related protein [Sphingomonas sp.]
MSAIGGIIDWRGGVDSATLGAMAAAAPGFFGANGSSRNDGHAGLVRVALATTPQAVGEVQPWHDAESARTICFDGRVDNRDELRALIGSGAPPADAPDCAIVLAAWQRFGEGLLDRLVGDFAFAVWDARTRQLSCARSPIGWRPFLWAATAGGIAFATEPAMLIRGAGISRAIDEGTIGEHLSARFVTETDTLWKHVKRLPPGHLLVADAGDIRTRRWLEGPFEDFSRLSDSEHIERFCELFDQALIATARSAGPVAAHLSGGLDSSSVVCRSHDLVDAGRLAAMPRTVSARFPGEPCDEGRWIEAVEAQCGIRSQTVTGARYDWSRAANWSADTLHLPLRPNTAATIMASCDWLHANHLSVLLTGEGGDDWLTGGFAYFPDLLRAGRLPSLVRDGLSAGFGTGFAQRLRWTLSSAIGPIVSSRRRARVLRPHLDFTLAAPDWIAPDWAQRIGLVDRWREAPRPPAFARMAHEQRYAVYSLARRHMNTDNVLGYAASKGVELRHPFHDFRLTRFAMGASGGMLRRHGVRKFLLREAMRGSLPEMVRQRTDKADMSAPVYDAVADRLRERPIADLAPVRNGWIDAGRLAAIEAEHAAWRAKGATGLPPLSPYSVVWNTVALDLWLDHAAGLT